jgi:hypothetical protein
VVGENGRVWAKEITTSGVVILSMLEIKKFVIV